MDEETADTVPGSTTNPEPGFSGNTTVIKPKKKAAPTKQKVVKESAPAKRAKKEMGPAKKADKAAAPSKKTNKEAEPPKKADKEATLAGPSAEKPKILDLVCEAISLLGDRKKGLSVPAIKKYVKSKKTSEAAGFNTYVNKAINKGVEKGILVRPPSSKDATGAMGHFRLAKVEPIKRTLKAPRKKTDSEHASDSEATEKPVKPRKRNLSDTFIMEMKASTPKPLVKESTALKDTKRVKKVPKKNANDKKDTSDSKIVVKKTKRKSMKSYSSDTEVDVKKSKITKTAKQPAKAVSDKPKAAKANSSSYVSKAKVKKLYNSKEENDAKPGKTRAKKQE